MTFEESLNNLYEKYGIRFHWVQIGFTDKSFVKEAVNQIREKHPLYGKVKYSVAKCETTDEVLFLLDTGEWAIIHLTDVQERDERFPIYILFENMEKALAYMENSYRQNSM